MEKHQVFGKLDKTPMQPTCQSRSSQEKLEDIFNLNENKIVID